MRLYNSWLLMSYLGKTLSFVMVKLRNLLWHSPILWTFFLCFGEISVFAHLGRKYKILRRKTGLHFYKRLKFWRKSFSLEPRDIQGPACHPDRECKLQSCLTKTHTKTNTNNAESTHWLPFANHMSLDRSQSLFYFVPHEKIINQSSSTIWVPKEEKKNTQKILMGKFWQ